MQTLRASTSTGLMLLAGLLGCNGPAGTDSDTHASSESDSATDDDVGTDSSTSDSTTDTDTGTDTDTDTDTDTGVGCVCGTPECGVCPDALMIAGNGYMIEATETPVADYALFVAVEFNPALLHPACSWKTSFEPDGWEAQLLAPDLPVTKVDWCDAEAYCRWSGRHLCGTIGGGEALLAATENPNTEWYAACSNDSTLSFPYGSMYLPMACNGEDLMIGAALPVGSLATCEGGLPGLFDMSGNVREWANACGVDPALTDPNQLCQRRGGGFANGVGSLDCGDDSSSFERSSRVNTTGLRCCG